MDIKIAYTKLEDLTSSLGPEIIKASSGNKAAARRARKILLDIKNSCHQLRKDIQEAKD